MTEKNIPLPEPKPWIRTSASIIEQAQSMMTPPIDPQPAPEEEDPE